MRAAVTNLENKSWEAWKARDGSYFQTFTSSDHVDVGPAGTIGQSAVVAGVSSHACVVESYSLQPMKFVRIAADAALYLSGTAYDDSGRALAGERLRWLAGKRVLGSGRTLTVLGLPAGAQPLRLEARDGLGRVDPGRHPADGSDEEARRSARRRNRDRGCESDV